jgi:hypothetical protein
VTDDRGTDQPETDDQRDDEPEEAQQRFYGGPTSGPKIVVVGEGAADAGPSEEAADAEAPPEAPDERGEDVTSLVGQPA